MFATTVGLPNKQNEGISVPKGRAIRICRRHGHEAAYLPYLDDREMVGPTLQSSLPMKEYNLITTEGKRCCGHSAKEENYTACIGNSLVFIHYADLPQCIQTHITYSTSECMKELYVIYPYFLHFSSCRKNQWIGKEHSQSLQKQYWVSIVSNVDFLQFLWC